MRLSGRAPAILGNVEIGNSARIAAGSVFIHPLPLNSTAPEVATRVITIAGDVVPAGNFDQTLNELSYASFTYMI